MAKPERRHEWIDVAKFLAILAVLVDHTGGILYLNDNIAYASYFSVCVFILVMGITSYWSYQKSSRKAIDIVRSRCVRILGPYITATFVYCLFSYRSFSLEVFLNHVIHFDASPPLYYVLLYVQLMIVSPVLYHLLAISSKKKYGWLLESATVLTVIFISSLTTNDTNILNVSGGGGKLFGGSYLTLFCFGMWFGKHCSNVKLRPGFAAAGLTAGLILSVRWWQFFSADRMRIDRMLPFGSGYNPPSISLIIYAVLIAGTVFFAGQIPMTLFGGIYKRLFGSMARLGRHTLYIFLYHKLLLDLLFMVDVQTTGVLIDHIWFKRAAYLSGMIIGSLLIEALFRKAGRFVSAAYGNAEKT